MTRIEQRRARTRATCETRPIQLFRSIQVFVAILMIILWQKTLVSFSADLTASHGAGSSDRVGSTWGSRHPTGTAEATSPEPTHNDKDSHAQYRSYTSALRHKQYTRQNRRGRVVMRFVDRIAASDLVDITDDLVLHASDNQRNVSQHSTQRNNQLETNGKEPILRLLHDAGITRGIGAGVVDMLPTWRQVHDLYYSYSPSTNPMEAVQPIILGRCDPEANANMLLAVAGLFNSGTNALTYYLRANLVMPAFQGSRNGSNPERPYMSGGILTQVPWDKHWFSSLRFNHTIEYLRDIDKSNVLPIVIVRDPMTWFQSMLRTPYLVQWNRTDKLSSVVIPKMTGPTISWSTLFHLWKDWYRDYIMPSTSLSLPWRDSDDAMTTVPPYLLVRIEDLWFRPFDTMDRLRACTGARWKNPHQFTYVVDASKWEHVRLHGPQSTWVSSIIKHGNAQRRVRNMTREEILRVINILEEDTSLLNLIDAFGYQVDTLLGA